MDVAVRSLHLLAAAVWVGGLVFLGLAAGAARRAVADRERVELFRVLGKRFLMLSAVALVALVATGADMAADRLPSWDALTETTYGKTLLAKWIVLAVVIVLTAVHSFVLGPRVGRLRESLIERPGDAALEADLRRLAGLHGAVSGLILAGSVAILVLAADLVA